MNTIYCLYMFLSFLIVFPIYGCASKSKNSDSYKSARDPEYNSISGVSNNKSSIPFCRKLKEELFTDFCSNNKVTAECIRAVYKALKNRCNYRHLAAVCSNQEPYEKRICDAEVSNLVRKELWEQESWYKPPPDGYPTTEKDFGRIFESEIFNNLILTTPFEKRADILTLLGDKSIIELSWTEGSSILQMPKSSIDEFISKKLIEARDRLKELVVITNRNGKELKSGEFLDSLTHDERVQAIKQSELQVKDLENQIASTVVIKENIKPYLVRGVAFDEAGRSFSLKVYRDEIVVTNNCIGNNLIPLKRVPVVVFLVELPKKVYADFICAS